MDLVDRVLEAHGGADRWSAISGLTARISLGGPFWAGRGWPGIWADPTIDMDTARERITFSPFVDPGRSVTYDAGTGVVDDG
ncbi:MAG: hypothetical protein U0R18_16560 [Mycobacterium sp.]